MNFGKMPILTTTLSAFLTHYDIFKKSVRKVIDLLSKL